MRVVELHTYPVKGCAGIPLTTAMTTPAGLAHDRTFMIVDEDGVFRTQRRDPRLALIRPDVTPDGTELTLTAEGFPPLSLPVSVTAARREVRLFKSWFSGIDQGAAAADWLTGFLGAPSRLVRVPPDHDRVTDGETPGTSGYADSSAVHVTTLVSLAALNARAPATDEPLPMARFRPNIVLDGRPGDPHAEDRLRHLTIGTTELGFTKTAIRCSVTLVDPATGHRAGPEPLRTLATYRRAPEGGVSFGVKFSVTRPGELSVGDEVTVVKWAE
ncbi:MOSC domain-containing protein [Streptomyces sp. NBC_01803]|uniref:MOSC domain-containing protein n=1 Tax=Streptomyces sp. NBC_01803 TaxID=2975946 RepID=UPI002DD8D945|nr:MOSC N-terminal beta barrel domain-containing protein [Streptomyces sp. NBC_01803]WSA46515.1 MOSC N-terminal beta barrel domain-containing protein [Streptomyces sp. NBC_01803]